LKSNSYLYGDDTEVPEIPAEVIMRRVELLDEHLFELLKVSYKTRDNARVRAVIKARTFWTSLNKKDI